MTSNCYDTEAPSATISHVPVSTLWPNRSCGNRELHAVLMLRGFIDESHDSSSVPQVFTLSCIVGFDNMIPWFEMAWVKVLEEKNAQLREHGRPLISRYHAADCSSRTGEFSGWTVDEQIEFSRKLFDVFRRHPLHIHAFDMPLQLLVREIPETATNPIGFAYVTLLFMVAHQISRETLKLYPHDKISLHHDHCEYDGALADAFGQIIDDKDFPGYDRYTSITPERWQNCIMLQPADLIAYENFKEGMQFHYPNPKIKHRRKSLQTLLDTIGGRASGLNHTAIRKLKTIVDDMNPTAKQRLFNAARIKT